ncbi:4-hydroxy-3-methylbut-2-enyl diphosphate reductase [Planctomycetaceae bacterium SH139]
MKIIRATEMGMCFGVRDALQLASEVSNPTAVTIHGELVHNPKVIEQLSDAGFAQVAEHQREALPTTPLVLITAHGISNAERSRLQSAGKQFIDTTCPLVRRVHDAALTLAAEGRHVLLIGKPGHVEVLGITEDLQHCDVVPSAADVRSYQRARLGIICQTTMPSETVAAICASIRQHNPDSDIRFVDTVCHPTKRRQQAMLELLPQVDAVVVVGGHNSNNTRRLTELCQQHNVPAVQVASAAELQSDWFADFATVGLTAGTSTLDETINSVHTELKKIARAKHSIKPQAQHWAYRT